MGAVVSGTGAAGLGPLAATVEGPVAAALVAGTLWVLVELSAPATAVRGPTPLEEVAGGATSGAAAAAPVAAAAGAPERVDLPLGAMCATGKQRFCSGRASSGRSLTVQL